MMQFSTYRVPANALRLKKSRKSSKNPGFFGKAGLLNPVLLERLKRVRRARSVEITRAKVSPRRHVRTDQETNAPRDKHFRHAAAAKADVPTRSANRRLSQPVKHECFVRLFYSLNRSHSSGEVSSGWVNCQCLRETVQARRYRRRNRSNADRIGLCAQRVCSAATVCYDGPEFGEQA